MKNENKSIGYCKRCDIIDLKCRKFKEKCNIATNKISYRGRGNEERVFHE